MVGFAVGEGLSDGDGVATSVGVGMLVGVGGGVGGTARSNSSSSSLIFSELKKGRFIPKNLVAPNTPPATIATAIMIKSINLGFLDEPEEGEEGLYSCSERLNFVSSISSQFYGAIIS